MAAIDHAYSKIRTLGGTFRFFRNGWGPYHARHTTFLSRTQTRSHLPPPSPDIHWHSLGIAPFSIGTFPSPCAHFLPSESGQCRFLFVPPRQAHSNAIVLHLAATGEHGFLRRLITTALWLRSQNVASIILESPFYGVRRPKFQHGAMLTSVHHLTDLGRATIEESCALLHHFRENGYTRQAVTGTSQGGLHAAMVSSICEWPIGLVAAFAPHSAAPVFTKGLLSQVVDWQALEDGTSACPRDKLSRVLSITDIANFPQSMPANEILLLAHEDRYVTRDCVHAWQAARPEIDVRWLDGGHVTGALCGFPTVRHCILQAIPQHETA